MELERHDIRTFVTKHKSKENEVYLEAQKQLELLRNRFKMAQKAIKKYLDWTHYNQGIESEDTVEIVVPSIIWKRSEAKPVKLPEKKPEPSLQQQIEEQIIKRIPIMQLEEENVEPPTEGEVGEPLPRTVERLDETPVQELDAEHGRDGDDSEGAREQMEKTIEHSVSKSKRGRKRKRQKGS